MTIRLKILISWCLLLVGCQESSFELAGESRLPKWIEVPDSKSREDYTVRLTYYLFPWEKSVFKLKNKYGITVKRIVAKRKGGYLYPKKMPDQVSSYPSYEVLIYKGETDIIEHRAMETVFYLTDSPEVWQALDNEAVN